MEFVDLRDDFEIMTKYQHYGMCTRLLDITSNPLVALFFACKSHGQEQYEDENGKIEKEPFGIIYMKKDYPILSDDINVKILTALIKYDLAVQNTLEQVLEYLYSEGIISEIKKEEWLKRGNVNEFIEIIQNTYMVMPRYSNDRLVKQSGAFLLPGMFSFTAVENVSDSIINKCKHDLKSEFDKQFFYIDGDDKEKLLNELDIYNINEATLFPELEHQLEYIKQSNRSYVRPVEYFIKYQEITSNRIQNVIVNVDDSILDKHIEAYIKEIISNPEINTNIISILHDNMREIDWYKRENIQSKMKMHIAKILVKDDAENNISAKEKANNIVKFVVDDYIKLAASNCEKKE